MPLLDFISQSELYPPGDDPEKRRLWLWHRIYAVMLWPRDADRRDHAVRAMYAGTIEADFQKAPPDEPHEFPAKLILTLIAGGAAIPEFLREEEARSRHGHIAGAILLEFVGAALSEQPVELKNCKSDVAKTFKLSSSTVQNSCWDPFKSVAHLWAAARVLAPKPPDHMPDTFPGKFPVPMDNLHVFLAIAETFRNHGEADWPGGKAALPGRENWAVPPGIPLPRPQITVSNLRVLSGR